MKSKISTTAGPQKVEVKISTIQIVNRIVIFEEIKKHLVLESNQSRGV